MQKRYVFVMIVVVLVAILIWRLSTSYAIFNPGYEGNNLVSGDKWAVNIIEVSEPEVSGKALITSEVITIGTTLNFNVSLFNPGDAVSFDIKVLNSGKFDAELYAMTLSGLSSIDSEVITYELTPLDYLEVHNDQKEGSIMAYSDMQSFRISVRYEDNVAKDNIQEYNLNLGSTIIYKQR